MINFLICLIKLGVSGNYAVIKLPVTDTTSYHWLSSLAVTQQFIAGTQRRYWRQLPAAFPRICLLDCSARRPFGQFQLIFEFIKQEASCEDAVTNDAELVAVASCKLAMRAASPFNGT